MPTARLLFMLGISLIAIQAARGQGTAPAGNQRQRLKKLVEQLQASPENDALREETIKLALTLKPKPSIPEEARAHFLRGNTAFKDATGPDDYDRAIDQYKQAAAIAPWWSDVYFNEAKALAARNRYEDAIKTLKLCLKADPDSSNARAEQDMIYELEDKNEKWKKSPDKKEEEAAKRRANAMKFVDRLNKKWPALTSMATCEVGDRPCTEEEEGGKNWSWHDPPQNTLFSLDANGEPMLIKWSLPWAGDEYFAAIDDIGPDGGEKIDEIQLKWFYTWACRVNGVDVVSKDEARKCRTWPAVFRILENRSGRRVMATTQCYDHPNRCTRNRYVFADPQTGQ